MAQLKSSTITGTLTLYGDANPWLSLIDNSNNIGYLQIASGNMAMGFGYAQSLKIDKTGNITIPGYVSFGNIPATLKNLCSNGASNSAPGYVLGFNTDYLSSGYTSVANLRNTMGAPLMVSDGSYYTLAAPSGSAISWLRTPTSGLIPYASGGASSGLGSSSWPFNVTYTNRVISKNFLTGSTTIATTADAVSSATVTFATAMTGAPKIAATASSTVPNTVREVCIGSAAATGFTIYEYRTNGTDNSVHWLAYYR